MFTVLPLNTGTAAVCNVKFGLGKTVPLGVLVIWLGVTALHDQPVSLGTTIDAKP